MENNHNALIALWTGEALSERSGEYWSEEEQDTLNRLLGTGYGISEIAVELRRSEMAICQQLLRRNMLAQQGKPRTRREQPEKSCHCPRCTDRDCPRCGKEKPDAGSV